MGWLSVALYGASALVGGIYYAYIDSPGADRATMGSFMFPDGNAVILFAVTAGFLLAASILAAAAVPRGRKLNVKLAATERVATASAPQSAASPVKPQVERRQFYDLCDGMQIDRRIDNRRSVRWPNGKQVGWFDPTSYNGWRVSDENGAHVGEAADIPAAVALLKSHLAKL